MKGEKGKEEEAGRRVNKGRAGKPWVRKHPGLCRHARELGVSHPHLWMVLNGWRESRSLTARYQALVESEKVSG